MRIHLNLKAKSAEDTTDILGIEEKTSSIVVHWKAYPGGAHVYTEIPKETLSDWYYDYAGGTPPGPEPPTPGSYWDTGLPVVIINTGGRTIPSPDGDWLADTTIQIYQDRNTILYESNALEIRGRGNSTWTAYPKKPYALKLESKSEILGMPSSKRWCLLANYADRTLMRNDIAFKLGQMTSLDWTPHGKFVEVVLNGSHIGNYYLSEQIRVEPNRVDIDEMDDYLLEIDSYYDEDYKFRSGTVDYPYNIKSPDAPNVEYIKGKIDYIESVLLGGGYFAPYIHYDSFIDYWLVTEFTGLLEPRRRIVDNPSEGPHSMYCQLIVGTGGQPDRLKMGPLWDFDWSTFQEYFEPAYHYGIVGLPTTELPEENFYMPDKYVVMDIPYYKALFQNAEFVQRVKQRWHSLSVSFAMVLDLIEDNYTLLEASDALNSAIWPLTKNRHYPDGGLTFRGAVDKMLRVCTLRYRFMDQLINNL